MVLFPVPSFQFLHERTREFGWQVVLHIALEGRRSERAFWLDVDSIDDCGVGRDCFNKESVAQAPTEVIRNRVIPVNDVSGFAQDRKQIEFPKSCIECRTLELFNEVPVGITEVEHHRLHDALSRREPELTCDSIEIWISSLGNVDGREKIHRSFRLVS